MSAKNVCSQKLEKFSIVIIFSDTVIFIQWDYLKLYHVHLLEKNVVRAPLNLNNERNVVYYRFQSIMYSSLDLYYSLTTTPINMPRTSYFSSLNPIRNGIWLHYFNIENIILMFANLSQKRFYGTFQNMILVF